MPAGNLRYRIGFYQRGTSGGGGSPPPPDYGSTPGYPTTATFITFGNIDTKPGTESIEAARLTGKNFSHITVRQSPETRSVDVDWKCKDEDSGIEYNIRSVIDPAKGSNRHGMWLELLCESGVAI